MLLLHSESVQGVPGGPSVRTLIERLQVWGSLLEELRSYKLHSAAKKIISLRLSGFFFLNNLFGCSGSLLLLACFL